MKMSMSAVAFCLVAFAPMAGAYEYPLQFTPNPGYRGLVVAGYAFEGSTVVGNCSYYTTGNNGGGKGGGGKAPVAKVYAQTCRWDMFGNLLSVRPGAPVAAKVLSTKGTQVIFAETTNGEYTGTDSKLPERGFVNSKGSHYTWLTPNYDAVLQQMAYTLVATLESDGDTPVDITAVAPSALRGAVTLKSSTCHGVIAVGKTCSITVLYDPTKLISVNGLARDSLRIDLTSDAGEAHDFIQRLTIVVPKAF